MAGCPYHELGLQRGASVDDVKRKFKEKAFEAIKEAYDTLVDDRKRAAYEASSSPSPYQQRAGRGASWANTGVDTDWSRRGSDSGGGVSRLSRWEWWRRWVRQEARAFDRTLHGGLAVLTLGGLLLFSVGGDLIWSSRNAGRSFEAAMKARDERAAAAAAAASRGRAGTELQGQEEVGGASTAKRRPGVWLDSMRGRTVAVAAAEDDGPAAAAAAAAARSSGEKG